MSRRLWPFFSYYGAKWRAAPHYPEPVYATLIEPFGGSACYALTHPYLDVNVYDIDPVIVGVWDYLIRAPVSEVLALPLAFEHVDDLPLPSEAKHLIGFWLNKGAAAPGKRPSAWARSGKSKGWWGEEIRSRIANQQQFIRHWRVDLRSYETLDDRVACWFIDPPYAGPAGRHYAHSTVDYAHLAKWCLSRRGQVIVCEQEGANWLPFRFLTEVKSNPSKGKKVREVVWTKS